MYPENAFVCFTLFAYIDFSMFALCILSNLIVSVNCLFMSCDMIGMIGATCFFSLLIAYRNPFIFCVKNLFTHGEPLFVWKICPPMMCGRVKTQPFLRLMLIDIICCFIRKPTNKMPTTYIFVLIHFPYVVPIQSFSSNFYLTQ